MQTQPRFRPLATFHGIFAILTLLLWWMPAAAATLSVGDLRLEYGPPWQRAEADEESRLQSIILHLADATTPLTVMLPRHQPRLRMTEERFYRQLETVWRAQYGETARVDWLEAGGRRWRMVRRPSLDQTGSVVFHLVTVLEGRAHHLLAYAPTSAAELPEAIIGLLTGPVGAHEKGDTPASSTAVPATALPPHWRLERILRSQPGQSGLDHVMTLERRALKGEGGITGVALEVKEHGFKGFLQGFVWVAGPDHRTVRREFMQRWELAWAAPPQLWRDDEAAAIVVSSAAGSDRVTLGISLRYLCGGAAQLRELLDDVERAQADARQRLEAGFASCRDRVKGLTQAEATVGAGETARPILIQPPAKPTPSADEQGLLVLTLQPRVADDSQGQALLGFASVHYVYVRGQ